MARTEAELLVEWLQIGLVVIEHDGSAHGPMGWRLESRVVRALLGHRERDQYQRTSRGGRFL
jgi:hypothetical protein